MYTKLRYPSQNWISLIVIGDLREKLLVVLVSDYVVLYDYFSFLTGRLFFFFDWTIIFMLCRPSWLVDSNRIATKIKSASGIGDPERVKWKSNPTKACPNCHHVIDNSDVYFLLL